MAAAVASVAAAADVLAAALREVSAGLVEREALVETIALAAVAAEHLLVIGPPGTAKSEAVRRFARAVEGDCFEYLLGRFTEPSEIFGPIDLRKLREGTVETAVHGMLPEAEVAFLDEVFQGSTAILNTLLGILNERVFRRGHTRIDCPLRVCVGASNALPQDESLAAFADRFLVRVFVEPIGDSRLEELLEGGWRLEGDTGNATASIGDLDLLTAAARQADLQVVRPLIAQAVRLLRRAGVNLTDRRVVKLQKLVASAGVLAGRTTPTAADLWPIVVAVPTAEGQEVARETLREFLAASEGRALAFAAEEASFGPLARARRLCASGRELLAAPPATAGEMGAHRLRLEAVAREIDAGFLPADLPADLAEVRRALVRELGGDPAGGPAVEADGRAAGA